jgi:hypothetical protein
MSTKQHHRLRAKYSSSPRRSRRLAIKHQPHPGPRRITRAVLRLRKVGIVRVARMQRVVGAPLRLQWRVVEGSIEPANASGGHALGLARRLQYHDLRAAVDGQAAAAMAELGLPIVPSGDGSVYGIHSHSLSRYATLYRGSDRGLSSRRLSSPRWEISRPPP